METALACDLGSVRVVDRYGGIQSGSSVSRFCHCVHSRAVVAVRFFLVLPLLLERTEACGEKDLGSRDQHVVVVRNVGLFNLSRFELVCLFGGFSCSWIRIALQIDKSHLMERQIPPHHLIDFSMSQQAKSEIDTRLEHLERKDIAK